MDSRGLEKKKKKKDLCPLQNNHLFQHWLHISVKTKQKHRVFFFFFYTKKTIYLYPFTDSAGGYDGVENGWHTPVYRHTQLWERRWETGLITFIVTLF